MVFKHVPHVAAAFVLSLPLLTSTASVSATPVALEYNGPASAFRTLEVTSAPISGVTRSTLAGGFDMTDTSGVLDDFIAWCLDLAHFLGTSEVESYVITNTPFSNSFGVDADGRERLQAFFDANYTEGLEEAADLSAAFQVGLWEVLYDTDFTLAEDGMRTDEFAGTSTVSATVEGFLDAAEAYDGPQRWRLSFLESTGKGTAQRQNLVTVSAVPLPAAGLLLVGGLGGLAAFARRRKAAA